MGTLGKSQVAPGSENARRGVVVLRVQDAHARMVDVTVQGGPAAVLAPAVVVVRAHVAPVRHLEPRANLWAGMRAAPAQDKNFEVEVVPRRIASSRQNPTRG